MAVMFKPRAKQIHTSPYSLAKIPLCPVHQVLCLVYSVQRDENGDKVQYRKCPKCDHTSKNLVKDS